MKPVLCLLALLPGAVAAQPVCLKEAAQAALQPGVFSWHASSGSMKPTLEPGDCFVTKRQDTYQPGDIIAFWDDRAEATYIFRLIATEGQTVQMIAGALQIDGVPMPRQTSKPYLEVYQLQNGFLRRCPGSVSIGGTCEITQYAETLNGRTYGTLDLGEFGMDNTGVYEVPVGHVFVLGDHRDNASDSRVPVHAGGRGFVPVDAIIGAVPPE